MVQAASVSSPTPGTLRHLQLIFCDAYTHVKDDKESADLPVDLPDLKELRGM